MNHHTLPVTFLEAYALIELLMKYGAASKCNHFGKGKEFP